MNNEKKEEDVLGKLDVPLLLEEHEL